MRTGDIPALAQLNATIFDGYVKAKSVLEKHDDAMVSVSGGADSDVVVDIIARLDADHKVQYIYFDTGLEYQATKDHLVYLEQTYGIEIRRFRAKKPVPYCTKLYGQPFVSKQVSKEIERLQRHGFKWEDRPYEELAAEYPGCTSAIKWWCNKYQETLGYKTMFNIHRNKWLKEFLVTSPPTFDISLKCCTYAKKATAHEAQKNTTLIITGVRKAEGGIRSAACKTCFDSGGKQDSYRPIFWYTDADKAHYKELFALRNSDCYEVYGMKRTGCVGCPYNRKLDQDQGAIKKFEPRLYKACNNVFRESYEYTRQYREFYKKMEG